MSKACFKFLLIITLGLLSKLVFAHEFTIIASGDTRYPSVEACHKMGVSILWFYIKLPHKFDKNGKPVNSKKMNLLFKRFKGSNITLIPLLNIFNEKNSSMGQMSRFSTQKCYRCFSRNNNDIIRRTLLLTKWLKRFENFGGLCIDDEPGIQPGGCICKNCTRLFQKTGYNVPSLDDYLKASERVVSENNLVLTWDNFQKTQMVNYYTSLAKAIKEKHPKLKIFTIPAAAYFSGKQLTIPNCKPENFIKSKRRVTLDPCHIRNFQLYVQFYINEIDSSGWKNKIADGLCLYMLKNGVPNFSNIPVYDKFKPVTEPAVISVAAFKRFILQTFSEGAKGIVYFPGRSLSPQHVEAAAKIYRKYILPICTKTPDLHKPEGKVAVLYSTTTRTFADIWQKNPLERYKHLHESDALAYYLLKKGIPFEMLLENEISCLDDLQHFSVIISSGLNYLRADKFKLLEKYLKKGNKLLIDKNSKINLGTPIDFDASYWYQAVKKGNQSEADMEYQADLLDSALSKYLKNISAPCKISTRHINMNYLTDGKNIYLFLVNNNLNKKISSEIIFNTKYDIYDIISEEHRNNVGQMPVIIPPGELKVIKIKQHQALRKIK